MSGTPSSAAITWPVQGAYSYNLTFACERVLKDTAVILNVL